MAYAKPIICLHILDTPEYVSNFGILIDPRNAIKEIIESLRTLIKDRETLIKLQKLSKERIAKFNIHKFIENIIKVYKEVSGYD